MTYLEIVNEVLRRLRETTVTTYNQTTYSTMVGDFVNDAKNQVEQAWDWSCDRSILTVPTVASTQDYTLTGFGQDGKILSSYNDTQNSPLHPKSQAWMDHQNYTANSTSGSPCWYCFRGEDASQDAKIQVWPIPDGVYSLKFNCSIPQGELSNGETTIKIPWRPVVLLAVAMLAEEKGETGGASSARYFEMADKALADAIAYDAQRHPAEAIWYEI